MYRGVIFNVLIGSSPTRQKCSRLGRWTQYVIHYSHSNLAPLLLYLISPIILGLTKFFVHIKKRLNRDYIVVMDMSGSMAGRKWEQAKAATMKIAPFACQADPDGITLYLFNGKWPSFSPLFNAPSPRSCLILLTGRFSRFEHLTQAAQVQGIFSRQSPTGTTDLAGVLSAAFKVLLYKLPDLDCY